jgi:hypothetical protein
MFTALAMVLVLGQPYHSCATCGAGPVEEGANGWFPLCTPKGWDRIRNMCSGPIIGLGAAKCPCPLGVAMPYGDTWAMQMHADYRTQVPASAPTPPPSPTPAAGQPGAGAAAPAPNGAQPEPTATAPAVTPAPLTPLP